MSDRTGIEWANATWNPIVGCSRVSPGCEHCYAEQMALRVQAAGHPAYQGLIDQNVRWTGRVSFNEAALEQPLKWKRPRRIFVNSMGDLFHPNVRESWIDSILNVMLACPQHTFLVLTKRPELLESKIYGIGGDSQCRELGGGDYLPNLWLGVTAENQEQLERRVPYLLKCPAAKLFVSYEPALGPINISPYLRLRWDASEQPACMRVGMPCRDIKECGRYQTQAESCSERGWCQGIDWVVAGGETGPNARPAHPQWFRDVRYQCAEAGVPFFFKQWGEWSSDMSHQRYDLGMECKSGRAAILHPSGRDSVEIMEETGTRSTERGSCYMFRVGSARAGRLLDGREHNDLGDGR